MPKIGKIFKENRQFVLSAILVIVIPIILIANTSLQMELFQKKILEEAQSKAMIVQTVLANTIDLKGTDYSLIQQKIESIQKNEPDFKEISILIRKQNSFSAIASTQQGLVDIDFRAGEYNTAWIESKPYITTVHETGEFNKTEKVLVVVAPIYDQFNTKIALVSFKLATGGTQEIIEQTINQSLIFLAIAVILTLILLVNHVRFYEYALLLKKIKEVDEMKDEFISIASHEMKTPMAAIKGYMQMIMEGLVGKTDDKVKEHLVKISEGIQRLDVLVAELLDVSRLDQNRIQLDMQALDLKQIVQESYLSFADMIKKKGLSFGEEKSNQALPQIFADHDRLKQVFDNLIGNAIKYTEKGGIKISYTLEKNKLVATIKDTGIGMSPEDQRRLFEKFYRIRNDKTVEISGTGLGLWITKELIGKMNGEIKVKSIENRGSEFSVILPYINEK